MGSLAFYLPSCSGVIGELSMLKVFDNGIHLARLCGYAEHSAILINAAIFQSLQMNIAAEVGKYVDSKDPKHDRKKKDKEQKKAEKERDMWRDRAMGVRGQVVQLGWPEPWGLEQS